MAAKYKVLFSDIGGVLLSNGWPHESREKAAQKFGLDYEEMNALHNFIFNVFEIGRITLDQYLDTVVFHTERKFSKEEFTEFMMAQSTELPEMLEWFIGWRNAHPEVKIISINNEAQELNDHRIKKFRLHDFFDAFVSSCVVGMRKPDPGIFRIALGIAQAEPSDCIYFDDRPMLVLAAKKEGIHAYHHHDINITRQIINEAFD